MSERIVLLTAGGRHTRVLSKSHLAEEVNEWISRKSRKPWRACVSPPCSQGRASPLQALPADEAAPQAQVAPKRRKPGNPGEAERNRAQVAPKKRRKHPEPAAEAEPRPVQVAPKKKRKHPEPAGEAEPSSSAVCTAVPFQTLNPSSGPFSGPGEQPLTPPSGSV